MVAGHTTMTGRNARRQRLKADELNPFIDRHDPLDQAVVASTIQCIADSVHPGTTR
jgi:hypothetical protein